MRRKASDNSNSSVPDVGCVVGCVEGGIKGGYNWYRPSKLEEEEKSDAINTIKGKERKTI